MASRTEHRTRMDRGAAVRRRRAAERGGPGAPAAGGRRRRRRRSTALQAPLRRARRAAWSRSRGRWRFQTADDLAFLMTEEREEPRRLSRAAQETLAIVAYHQPVTRAEIEAIRGVQASRGTLDLLLEIGLVRPARPAPHAGPAGHLRHHRRLPRALRPGQPGRPAGRGGDEGRRPARPRPAARLRGARSVGRGARRRPAGRRGGDRVPHRLPGRRRPRGVSVAAGSRWLSRAQGPI